MIIIIHNKVRGPDSKLKSFKLSGHVADHIQFVCRDRLNDIVTYCA